MKPIRGIPFVASMRPHRISRAFPQPEMVEPQPEMVEPEVVEPEVVEPEVAEPEVVEPEVVEPEVVAVPSLVWDASMRKGDLLKIAQDAGLSVTETNTKAQIIAALQTLE